MTGPNAFSRSSDIIVRFGLDPTLNRILVLSALSESDHPLTARDVYEELRHRHKLNRVTVYRILDLFAEKGVVSKISTGERSFCYCARFGRWPQGHCHFHCTRCGKVECIDKDLLALNPDELKNRLSLDVRHIELRLDGVCTACKEKGTMEGI